MAKEKLETKHREKNMTMGSSNSNSEETSSKFTYSNETNSRLKKIKEESSIEEETENSELLISSEKKKKIIEKLSTLPSSSFFAKTSVRREGITPIKINTISKFEQRKFSLTRFNQGSKKQVKNEVKFASESKKKKIDFSKFYGNLMKEDDNLEKDSNLKITRREKYKNSIIFRSLDRLKSKSKSLSRKKKITSTGISNTKNPLKKMSKYNKLDHERKKQEDFKFRSMEKKFQTILKKSSNFKYNFPHRTNQNKTVKKSKMSTRLRKNTKNKIRNSLIDSFIFKTTKSPEKRSKKLKKK